MFLIIWGLIKKSHSNQMLSIQINSFGFLFISNCPYLQAKWNRVSRYFNKRYENSEHETWIGISVYNLSFVLAGNHKAATVANIFLIDGI